MSARALAFELAQLPSSQRERLLAELPAPRRAQLQLLLEEVAVRLDERADEFAKHLQAAAVETAPPPFSKLNDGQLRLLLSAEHPAVQKRIAAVVRAGQVAQLAPAVAAVINEHLSSKGEANEIRCGERQRRRGRWWTWKR